MRGSPVALAIAIALILAVSLILFIPYAPVTSDISEYESSSYYPLIESIEDYRLELRQPKTKNNFETLEAIIISLLRSNIQYDGDMAPESGDSYVEFTDNQVSGIIEQDLVKMSDKYIFRLNARNFLMVYSIDKENSEMVASFKIDHLTSSHEWYLVGMYLSEDCNTVTVIRQFNNSQCRDLGIVSIDVSDINNIHVKNTAIVSGKINTTRMINGKLLIVTNSNHRTSDVDYNVPESFVPYIDTGDGPAPMEIDDIIIPDKVNNMSYGVVSMFDEDTLELIDAKALLNFTNTVYVAKDNLYITNDYTVREINGKITHHTDMSDIAVLGYSDEGFEEKAVFTVLGQMKDQYSFDEKDGYLRAVASTSERDTTEKLYYTSTKTLSENVSLYVFDIEGGSLAYKVEDFAINGEEATAVRFEGDKLYVCTAQVFDFTDPVFFFDLSDYENITYTDTGIIDGFSSSLINYGDGLALGIGQQNWEEGKVEMYAERDGAVVSIAEFRFLGTYSANYKSYLIDRENRLVGFTVDHYEYVDEQTGERKYHRDPVFLLLQFDGEEFKVLELLYPMFSDGNEHIRLDIVRAVCIDGYLYITQDHLFRVEQIG